MAVMIVHITAVGVTDYIHGSFPNIVTMYLNRSLKFTTPVFIFLSGVTGFYSYRNGRELKYLPFLWRRLKKVLIPYIVWTYVYYRVHIELGYYGRSSEFFWDRLMHGTISFHLYFVIIIVQLYVLGPIFYNIVKKSPNRLLTLTVSAVITALCVEYMRFELADRVFFKYMFFYMLGIYVTLEYDKFTGWVKRHRLTVIVGYLVIGVIYTAVTYYNMVIYTMVWFAFCTISIFFVYSIGLMLRDWCGRVYGAVKLFGQSSYYIYLMHPLIITFITKYAVEAGILSVTMRLVMQCAVVIPVTVICCMSYTACKNKAKSALSRRKEQGRQAA